MIPDGIEPVVGYRAFLLDKSGALKSIGKGDSLWEPGENEACCVADLRAKWVRKNVDGELKRVKILWHGLIPEPKCDCGFWLLDSSQAVVDHFWGPRRQDSMFMVMASMWRGADEERYVIAEAKGWGRVIQAENGWRTEYAAVTALLEGSTEEPAHGKLVPDSLVHKIAENYGVPVVQPDYTWPKKRQAVAVDTAATDKYTFTIWDDLSGSVKPPVTGDLVVPDPATIAKVTGA